jgi:hypothetical protein
MPLQTVNYNYIRFSLGCLAGHQFPAFVVIPLKVMLGATHGTLALEVLSLHMVAVGFYCL